MASLIGFYTFNPSDLNGKPREFCQRNGRLYHVKVQSKYARLNYFEMIVQSLVSLACSEEFGDLIGPNHSRVSNVSSMHFGFYNR